MNQSASRMRSPYTLLMIVISACLLSSCNIINVNQATTTAENIEPLSKPDLSTKETASEVAPALEASTGQLAVTATKAIIDEPVTIDLWQRLRNGFQLEREQTDSVNKIIKRYRASPKGIYQQTQQATLYLHYIIGELEKHDLPLELALIPFVESRYQPLAYSPNRAAGLWQFIPSTGTYFKLKRSWWHDERRDVVASTAAAIRYLNYLNNFFGGDWLLTMAAYNAGEGTIAKAIRKNKAQGRATDFWSLKLPKETQQYIPRILAWAYIIDNPQDYKLSLAPAPNQATFAKVDIGSQIDFAKLADISGASIDTLYALNPAYNRWATDPKPPHTLLLPIDKQQATIDALNDYPIDKRMAWQHYTIKKNDALSLIARKFGTTVATIKRANKLRSNNIRAGKTLLIPASAKTADYYPANYQQRSTGKKSPKNKSRIEYIVKNGDSFWSIAKKYNLSSSAIANWNNMSIKDTLKVRKKLVLWVAKKSRNS